MVRTPSTMMLALGTPLPSFALPGLDLKLVTDAQFRGSPGLLVAFICTHCPFVKHIRREFARFTNEYAARGLAIVGIASNDVDAFPEDGPEGMAHDARDAGYAFPYLFDETQEVAKTFRAACTPDLFLFDRGGALVYRGQFDSSRPGNGIPITGSDIRAAADAVLGGLPVNPEQRASIGCNIKWKRGNEPQYF
jgi:peroxiredoxin